MPFEPAPKTEQEDRVALGRIALEAIAAHILTVSPEKFDMGQWCGTACCAIGNSIRLPEVCATGLYIAPDEDGEMLPAFNGRVRHLHSIAKAFGISFRSADKFFSGGCRTAGEVSSVIRRYLKRTTKR